MSEDMKLGDTAPHDDLSIEGWSTFSDHFRLRPRREFNIVTSIILEERYLLRSATQEGVLLRVHVGSPDFRTAPIGFFGDDGVLLAVCDGLRAAQRWLPGARQREVARKEALVIARACSDAPARGAVRL